MKKKWKYLRKTEIYRFDNFLQVSCFSSEKLILTNKLEMVNTRIRNKIIMLIEKERRVQ